MSQPSQPTPPAQASPPPISPPLPPPLRSQSAPESSGEPPEAQGGGDAIDGTFLQLRSLLLGDDISDLETQVDNLKNSITKVEHTLFDPDQLLDRLVPIGAELVAREINESREKMCQAFTTIIDQVIYQRSQEDHQAMAEVIAILLPAALEAQITQSPQSIAQALAPEVSTAIREQIILKRGAVADALAEEMGIAIRRQIEMDRDAMVDALYPVIGRTINKYLQEVIQDINEKMANSLSPEGIQRKVRARVQGVSEAELILRESAKFTTRAIFLIHTASGLVIAETQGNAAEPLESDMLAGMLTAIRSFVEDCVIADDGGSELKEIEYGTSRILLEMAGSCYLAVLVAGEVPRDYQRDLRKMLGLLVHRYGPVIAEFDGDSGTVPEDIAPQLEALVVQGGQEKKETPPILAWIAGGVAMLALAVMGWFSYRNYQIHRVETAATQVLAQDPTLGFYNFAASLEGDRLVMRGRVPNENLRTLAEHRVETAIASVDGGVAVENQVRAVQAPPNPTAVAAEVYRTVRLLNQREGVALETDYRLEYDPETDVTQGVVTVNGQVGAALPINQVRRAIAAIPGVDRVVTNLAPSFPRIGMRLYFAVGSATMVTLDRQVKLAPLQKLLERSPQVRLKIIGYSPQDEPGGGQPLALERSRLVRQDLIDQGIDPTRLEAEGRVGGPPDFTDKSPDWTGRCVVFEAIP